MSARVYRIEVTHWPTPSGEPWERAYGDWSWQEVEIPEWLQSRLNSPDWRIQTRIQYDERTSDVALIVMPLPKRKLYLSASGVSELAANMRAFGAEVVIHRSAPIVWAD